VKAAEEQAAWKWTWGVDLTNEDLHCLIWGANSQYQVPHSGYDEDLATGLLQSQTSEVLNPANLEDWNDNDLWFDELSTSINVISELCSPEIPIYSFVLLGPSGDLIAKSEPDPVIEAFTKRARTNKKLLMQNEVNQPAGYLDYETHFCSQSKLIPCQLWLASHLPIILPLSTIVHGTTHQAETSIC